MAGEYLTMAEIEARYPNEWVLIDRPKTTKYQQVLGGYVIRHSQRYEDLDPVIETLPQPFDIAVRYTGPLLADDADAVL